ncbi:LamG-like jellyroll fold domain-containing protein [Candidatus Solirubrobacter pratensis]|uniref:LamG-like jellyroll fold domain-containing protein n=1 Tax=Candidatus Solirubrobacter pratensis TaxID=1298857 RepID=UPI0003F78511|nr:LamG-like jellyroll fold domain-containing protein [Candidatus Solirubrobacter pratensis]
MSYTTEVLADTPHLYYRMGGSTPIHDEINPTISLRDLVIPAGNLTAVAGALAADSDQARQFNGSTEYADRSGLDLSGTAGAPLTFECWCWIDAYSNDDRMLAEFGGAWSTNSGTFVIDPNNSATGAEANTVSVGFRTNLNEIVRHTFPRSAMSAAAWHHLVAVYTPDPAVASASRIKVYVDGAPVTTTSRQDALVTASTFKVSGTLFLMARGTTSLNLAGRLDEVAVYKGELSSTRVAAHYAAGTATTSPPANTTAPAITGVAETGQTLTCSTGTWANSPSAYAFQWKRAGAVISGATANAYALQVADQGQPVTCTVTATNAGGSVSADSNTVTPTAPAGSPPANTVAPALTGTAETGQTLACSNGSWTNSPTSFAFQWKRAGTSIPGATSSLYDLQPADEGQAILCTVTASNGAGSASADSNAVTPTAPATPPAPVSARMSVLVSGTWQPVTFARGSEGLNRFYVEDYVASGVSDQQAINDAIGAAFAQGRADGSHYAEVIFSAERGEYLLDGPTIKGGTTLGNAQIPLPICDDDEQKFTLVLKGTANASTWNHWNQDVAQHNGVILRSTLTGVATDPSYGVPSIIGGPDPTDAIIATSPFPSGWSNMLLVIDGLQVIAPPNPGLVAVNLKRIAMADVKSLSTLAFQTTAQMNAAKPTNPNGAGLILPKVGNNDNVTIDTFSCAGFYTGMTLTDHLAANRIGILFAKKALGLYGLGGRAFHGASILNLSVEASDTIIDTSVNAGCKFPVFIGNLNIETSTGTTFSDPTNGLVGQINFTDNNNVAPTVSGAKNVRITDLNRVAGAAPSTPVIPASATPFTNPFFRDAAVLVSGGTVTAIAVDGQTLGVTSGLVMLPSGKTITLTYSSAPTWTWTLL